MTKPARAYCGPRPRAEFPGALALLGERHRKRRRGVCARCPKRLVVLISTHLALRHDDLPLAVSFRNRYLPLAMYRTNPGRAPGGVAPARSSPRPTARLRLALPSAHTRWIAVRASVVARYPGRPRGTCTPPDGSVPRPMMRLTMHGTRARRRPGGHRGVPGHKVRRRRPVGDGGTDALQ